ncbi:MAG: hypothetical protein ACQERX_06250 [Bacillota bacterium]
MKTINKNLKVTDQEYDFLNDMFKNGYTLHRKIKLYGAGHPQLNDIFFIRGTEAQRADFWNNHETTHAKFKEYNSIKDMQNDNYLYRSDLVSSGNTIDDFNIKTYYL